MWARPCSPVAWQPGSLFDQTSQEFAKRANAKLGAKIRRAQLEKVPYMLVIGDKEAAGNTVSVRKRGVGEIGAMPQSRATPVHAMRIFGDDGASRLEFDAYVNDLVPWLELQEPFGPITL